MKDALKLLLAFSPWFAFWFIAGHSMLRLQIAIFVAAALVIVMAVTRLHRGAVLWAGYLFFAFALVSVVWLKNMWVIRHLGILATGTLFVTTLLSMLAGRPFTEDYAREHTPESLWESGPFVRGCYITTTAWACVFLVNCLLNVVKTYSPGAEGWRLTLVEYGVIAGGIAFSTLYSRVAAGRRSVASVPQNAAEEA